jgi:hypothetical protein
MVIADLIHAEDDQRLGRVYLSTAPFPGDIIRSADVELMVIRRTFLDLGPDTGAADRLSLELKVRPA